MLAETPLSAPRQPPLGGAHLRRAARTHFRRAGWKQHTHVTYKHYLAFLEKVSSRTLNKTR